MPRSQALKMSAVIGSAWNIVFRPYYIAQVERTIASSRAGRVQIARRWDSPIDCKMFPRFGGNPPAERTPKGVGTDPAGHLSGGSSDPLRPKRLAVLRIPISAC